MILDRQFMIAAHHAIAPAANLYNALNGLAPFPVEPPADDKALTTYLWAISLAACQAQAVQRQVAAGQDNRNHGVDWYVDALDDFLLLLQKPDNRYEVLLERIAKSSVWAVFHYSSPLIYHYTLP